MDEQWRAICKSRVGHENTIKNISKTKGRHRASFASYCLEKVDNKEQRAIKTKECGKMKEINLGKQKNVGVNTMEFAALNKTKAMEKAWNYCVEQKKVNRR